MEMYEWYPMECAPSGCPVEIIEGTFVLEDGTVVQLLTNSYIDNGWGAKGSSYLVGEELKPLPHFLLVTWLSFLDGIVYEGAIELPFDLIGKTFEEGFISPVDGKHKPYQYILVGMAPEGTLCMWLHQDGISKEVGCFKCKPDKTASYTSLFGGVGNLDIYTNQQLALYFKDIYGARTAYKELDKMVWGGLYREPYNLLLDVVSLGEPLNMTIDYFNGEREYRVFEQGRESEVLVYIPKELILNWISASELTKLFFFSFKEEEVFEAVRRIKEVQKSDQVVLQILLSENNSSCSVLIKSENHFIILNNCS